MRQSVIYKITNTVNGKFYVGSTVNFNQRVRTHKGRLRRGVHHSAYLQNAWNKHGPDVFMFHIVEVVPETESLQGAEDRWLIEHVGKPHCYNVGMRSDAPWRGIPKELHPSYGKPVPDEQKRQISTRLKEFYAEAPENHPRRGVSHTPESRDKMSKARRGGYSGERHHWYGRPLPEEVRKKIGDAQRGVAKGPRVFTPEGLERARANMARNAKKQTPLPFDKVYAGFPDVVKEKYDFSDAVYVGAATRITGILCKEHGEFSQYASYLRKGGGCPQCGDKIRRAAQTLTQEEFVARCREIHAGLGYDYTNTVYSKMADPVTVVCPRHGEFTLKAVKHYHSRQGCVKCRSFRRTLVDTSTT